MLSSTVHSPLVGLNSTISSISPELCPPENLVMNFMSSKAKLFPDIKNRPAVNVFFHLQPMITINVPSHQSSLSSPPKYSNDFMNIPLPGK